jgi:hypothetical protein
MADHELTLLRSQLIALQTQKRGLMQQLLTGKVRVPLPADEPEREHEEADSPPRLAEPTDTAQAKEATA